MGKYQLDLEDLSANTDASMTRLRRVANVAPLPEEAPTERRSSAPSPASAT